MNIKIIILIIALIGAMYYWITYPREGIERVIIMAFLVVLSYLLGREHQKIIDEGEIQYAKSKLQSH